VSTSLPHRVVLAAGGTGGHMFPAQALARELLARGVAVVLVTDQRGGGFGPDLPQVETYRISAGGLTGKDALHRLLGLVRLAFGLIQARRLLRRLRAEVVVGFGGYPSVPTVLAAAQQGRRVVLHEQNAVLGRANRLLAGYAQAIAISFDRVDAVAPRDREKLQVTGNPVRPAIAALGRRPYALPDGGDRLRLLVIGGSQGATIFNEVVPMALCRLPDDLRARLAVSQQVRGPALEEIAATYQAGGIACELKPFFDDMAERLAGAHLVIGRAGASTTAELTAAGRPGVLVPYPFATDDHQTANAKRLAATGGAWLMPQSTLTPDGLAECLEPLLRDPAQLVRAAQAARGAAHDEAACALADLVCGLAGNNGNSSPAPREVAA